MNIYIYNKKPQIVKNIYSTYVSIQYTSFYQGFVTGESLARLVKLVTDVFPDEHRHSENQYVIK